MYSNTCQHFDMGGVSFGALSSPSTAFRIQRADHGGILGTEIDNAHIVLGIKS